MSKIAALILSLCCILSVASAAGPSRYVDTQAWEEMAPHMMPKNHPAKKILDRIVSKGTSSVFYNMNSMVKAGFDHAIPQHQTRLIVTRHPKLKGYVIKAYLDTQEYYGDRPEYYYWAKRAEGATLIRNAIKKYRCSHLLKAPRKWIYTLPDKPYKALPDGCKPKRFILVEEDMDILDDTTSKKRWASPHATKELLSALHRIITEFRFRDCAKPANCPFAKDGKVALVDTQSFYKKKIGYNKLTRFLAPEMQQYWLSLSHVGVEGK